MQIRAALSRQTDGAFSIEEVTLREPGDGEILVKLVAAGICHTDLAVKSTLGGGASPAIFGHEGAGVVEAVGADVTTVKPGDHVILTFASCGQCACCTSGSTTYCENFRALNSGGLAGIGESSHSQGDVKVRGGFFGQSSFATHAITTESNTIVVPDELDLTMAAPLGCGVQTGAGAMMNVLRPGTSSTVLILGLGCVGLAGVMAAKVAGARHIVGVDPIASRRHVAVRLGATLAVEPCADLVHLVRDHTVGRGISHALDTTGMSGAIAQAFDTLGNLGQLVLVGLGMTDLPLDAAALMSGGKTIRGCIEGDARPHEFIPLLAQMYGDGALPLDLIVRHYPFEAINDAVHDMHAGETIKPVLVFQ